ncbi:hypothetical protein [Frankia sp. Cj3]|uniref:hypothetical protein n=1 Tax=Frankia sp. Cj3 TaxID=2880976 RepID=UPI001EF406A7|nr:hypothetical protein [Frankia sp. Cj3]
MSRSGRTFGDDDETMIRCRDIRAGDDLPDIGRVSAVSEPGCDGEFHIVADGVRTSLAWGGMVRVRVGESDGPAFP